MPKQETITAQVLIDRGCCKEYANNDFAKVFPNGTKVTLADCKKAAKAGLDLEWFADTFLTEKVYDEYRAKRKPLYDEYWTKLKPLNDEYYAKRKPLDDEYYAKRRPLYDEYNTGLAPILAECWKLMS